MIQRRAQARHDTHGGLGIDPSNSRSHQRHASLKPAGTPVATSKQRISPPLAMAHVRVRVRLRGIGAARGRSSLRWQRRARDPSDTGGGLLPGRARLRAASTAWPVRSGHPPLASRATPQAQAERTRIRASEPPPQDTARLPTARIKSQTAGASRAITRVRYRARSIMSPVQGGAHHAMQMDILAGSSS